MISLEQETSASLFLTSLHSIQGLLKNWLIPHLFCVRTMQNQPRLVEYTMVSHREALAIANAMAVERGILGMKWHQNLV